MSEERIITKYDYLRYFTRISRFWFHSNQEIDLYFQSALQSEVESEEEVDEADPEFEMYDFDELNKKDGKKDQKTAQMIEGNLIEERFVKFIQEEYPHLQLIDLRSYFEKEQLLSKTAEAIAHGQCILLQATFFSKKRMAICKTDFLIVENKKITIIEVKGTTTVKRKHFLDVFYQYQIATDAGYEISQIMMGLIRYERLKRGQISFVLTENCQLSKENSDQAKERYLEEHNGDEIKAGQARRLAEMSPTRFNLMEGVLKKSEYQGENERSLKGWNKFWNSFWNEHDFDQVIKRLREHEYKTLGENLKANDLNYPKLLGSEFYEYAPEVRAVIAKHDERFSFSGMITSLRWRNVLKNSELDLYHLVDDEKNSLIREMIQKNKNVVDVMAVTNKLAELKQNKVYFDFESINPAVRAADDTLPFQQVVTQCSVVLSNDINKKNNLIKDPQKITKEWWREIVESIHMGPDWSYVVYNKTFESSRLIEIKKMLQNEESGNMVDQINSMIFDLADIFDIRKKMTALVTLKGYYSIKKVLPLALSNITKPVSKDYSKLDVQKGTDAMELTMKRHFNQMSDKEWNQAEKMLCSYCENDVLAMIDVLSYAFRLTEETRKSQS